MLTLTAGVSGGVWIVWVLIVVGDNMFGVSGLDTQRHAIELELEDGMQNTMKIESLP